MDDAEISVSVIHALERHYALENSLMDAVRNGQRSQAFACLSDMIFPTENLQEAKHLCIATDALLRKAAEKGGVHPLHLDQISEQHNKSVEQQSTYRGLHQLFLEMSGNYCDLVRRFSTKGYALPVQKAIAYIDANLSGELRLGKVANALSISCSYLSVLFKNETGQTITDYIRNRRIAYAKMLLETSSLQVQTIAQHCGIWDVHYFSRIFKKATGRTPTAYRNRQKEL